VSSIEVAKMMAASWKQDLETMWKGDRSDLHMGERKPLCEVDDQEANTDNPYWEVIRLMPVKRWKDSMAVDTLPLLRNNVELDLSDGWLRRRFAYSIPTPGDLSWIDEITDEYGYGSITDMGAGTGYWAWQLLQMGLNVTAYDVRPPGASMYTDPMLYAEVMTGTAQEVKVKEDEALFLSWPPGDEPMAADCLKNYEGDLLFFSGEFNPRVTGDTEFFKLLDSGWHCVANSPKHITFHGLYCNLTAYRRDK
jgi:hypothetical protein